jgi:hypothetical protein
MRQAITLWSGLFTVFFASLNREVSNFFATSGHGKNYSKEPFHKIPRIGR